MNAESILLMALSLPLLLLATKTILRKEYNTAFLISGGLGITFVLFAFYLNGNRVDKENFGTPAEFGQLGDYFGGILNPIFGLTTIVILIYSIKIELNNSTRDSKVKSRSELGQYLTKCLKSFEEDLLKKEYFIPMSSPESYMQRYVNSNGHFKLHMKDEIIFLLTRTNELKAGAPVKPDDPEFLLLPFSRTRTKLFRIIDSYRELIKTNEHWIIKHGLKYDFFQWLIDQEMRGLIASNEVSDLQDEIEKLFENGPMPPQIGASEMGASK